MAFYHQPLCTSSFIFTISLIFDFVLKNFQQFSKNLNLEIPFGIQKAPSVRFERISNCSFKLFSVAELNRNMLKRDRDRCSHQIQNLFLFLKIKKYNAHIRSCATLGERSALHPPCVYHSVDSAGRITCGLLYTARPKSTR